MTLDEEKKREEIAYMYSVSVIMQTSVVQSQASQVYIYIYILSPFVDNENPLTFLNVASLFARVAFQSTVLIGVVLLDFCVIWKKWFDVTVRDSQKSVLFKVKNYPRLLAQQKLKLKYFSKI